MFEMQITLFKLKTILKTALMVFKNPKEFLDKAEVVLD